MATTYHAWCATCNTEWRGTEAGEREVPAGSARAFFICRECGHVGRASVRLTARELAEYRRALRKTISKMLGSFMRVSARLQERCRALRARTAQGDEKAIDALRPAAEKLAALTEPDVGHLERRFSAAGVALLSGPGGAPVRTPPVPCSQCGGETHVYRETPHGYDMTCPRCGGKIHTRVR